MNWIIQHQDALMLIALKVCGIATVLNALIPASMGPAWFHAALGRLSAFDKEGKMSLPIVRGNGGGAA